MSDDKLVCPLCDQPVHDDQPATSHPSPRQSEQTETEHSWFWEFTTFMVLAAVLVVFAADFAFGLHVTWSRFPLASLAWAWIFITAVRFLGKRPLLFISALTAASLGFLWFLSSITGGDWFDSLALPLVAALALAAVVTIILTKVFHFAVQSILAIAMLMLGAFLIVLEMVLSQFRTGTPTLSWSLMVFACILPLIVFLLVIHKRLQRKGFSFHKFFHA